MLPDRWVKNGKQCPSQFTITVSAETRKGMAKIALENLLAGIAGKKIPHEVLLSN